MNSVADIPEDTYEFGFILRRLEPSEWQGHIQMARSGFNRAGYTLFDVSPPKSTSVLTLLQQPCWAEEVLGEAR